MGFLRTGTTTSLLKATLHIVLRLLPLSVALPVLATPSATVTLVSDYVFRGVSLTDGPALQAGLDYAFDKGVTIGTWTSNYDFDTTTKREWDYYAGFSRKMNEFVTLSLYASRYTFLKEHAIDYSEFNFGLAYKDLDVKLWHAIDYGGTSADAQYFELGYHIDIGMIGLDFRAGHSKFEAEAGVDDYSDYLISATKSLNRFDLEFRFTDTSSDQFGDREKARALLSVSTSFP